MAEELDAETLALIDRIFQKIFFFHFIFAITGILITIPHLLITTRKAMRTSSTNSLLIGIAFCDLIVASVIVTDRIYGSMDPNCNNTSSYFHVLCSLIERILRETLTQTSYSLGLSLALIRLLVIKFSAKLGVNVVYLTKTSTGYLLVGLLGLLNSIPTFQYYKNVEIVNAGPWMPYGKCPELPVNYTESRYTDHFTQSQDEQQEAIDRYNVIRGIMQLCISVIYPILALLLFFEIRRAAKRVKNLKSDRSRTSRMVMLLTLSFVISSTPPGICYFFVTSVSLSPLGVMIVGYGTILCLTLFTANTSAHAIICLTMSSEYRKTVRKVLRIREKESSTDNKLFTSRGE